VIAVDEKGDLVDGDQMLAIAAIDLHDRGLLRGDAVVSTVMSNFGLQRALAPYGIELVRTPVGDRNVLDELERRDLVLGGEQSGHVINMLHATTGDGTLTGMFLLDAMTRRKRPLSELAAVMSRVPQVLRNIAMDVPDALNTDKVFWSRVRDIDDELGEDGRVLVRLSGTEPLVRVMVEAGDLAVADAAADRLVALIEHVARRTGPAGP
jgi:phosphoglucosamine mutase